MNNWTGNQNIPSRAEGKNLDALAGARAATYTMCFSISETQPSAVLIPAGTSITDAGKALVWETPEDSYVPIGEMHIDVERVTCQTVGTVGKGYAPDDEEYYQLMRSSMDTYSTAGAGVKRVELTAPEFTRLRDGGEKTVPQLAALRFPDPFEYDRDGME